MNRDGTSSGLSWADRIQWIVDHYEDGNRRGLGRRVGVTGQAVSAWARGETKPSGEGLAALVEAYPDLRARWLLTGKGAPRIAAEGGGAGLRPRVDGRPSLVLDADRDGQDDTALVERVYETGRRDAVEEMIAMLRQTAPVRESDDFSRDGVREAAE